MSFLDGIVVYRKTIYNGVRYSNSYSGVLPTKVDSLTHLNEAR